MKVKWIKRLSVLAVAVVATVTLAACGKSSSSSQANLITKGTLTVGLEGTYAPYSYKENGKLKGFEVDLARDVAKKLGYKVKFVPTKWDSLIAGLGSNKFDIVFNDLAETPQRKKAYAFSTPYIYSKSALITKKDSTISSIDDIKGQKVAAGTGTANESNVKKFGGTVVSSSDFASSMQLIQQGRVVAALNSNEAYAYYIKQNPNADLKSIEVPTSQIASQKIAAMMSKNNKGLQKKVNKALKELRQDGTLKKLSEKYFGTDLTEE